MRKTKLPGFGLRVDYLPEYEEGMFSCALEQGHYSYMMPLTTLREFAMLAFMNLVTDKPEWQQKVFDDSIVAKWAEEVLAEPDHDFSPAMIKACIDELRYKVKTFEETKAVSIFNGDVVKSDHAIPTELAGRLKREAARLEDVPDREKDWHPGSDEKVLDLVHPSLFPLVYGTTRVLEEGVTSLDDCVIRCGEGVTTGIPASNTQYKYSKKFQWLPCDVSLAEGTPRIVSYINNLHPQKHSGLYAVIEEVIDKAIPLWDMTLTGLASDEVPRRIEPFTEIMYNPSIEDFKDSEGPQRQEGQDELEFLESWNDWARGARRIVQPEAVGFDPIEIDESTRFNIKRSCQSAGIQVIVKLANIHLTPEKPMYEGGTWHVEGQLNEHICASAIYYYENSNITSSSLAFRQSSRPDDIEDVSYEQNEDEWLTEIFGCRNWSDSMQDVGTVETREGRLVTFPNILQHQVQPFQLKDHTKSGHRKILALFLVDPHIRVISTANVPCQRRDWWEEAVQNAASHSHGRWGSLPAELQDKIYAHVDDFPISMERAKELRVELMDERRVYVSEQSEAFAGEGFSLCEH